MTISLVPAQKLGLPIISVDGALRLVERVNVTLRGSLISVVLDGPEPLVYATFWREDVAREAVAELGFDVPVSWPDEWKNRKRRHARKHHPQPWELAA